MAKEKKYLYCPKCKNYPDTIVEEEIVMTRRGWDDDCYQGQEPGEYTGRCPHSYCGLCDTELVDNYDKINRKNN